MNTTIKEIAFLASIAETAMNRDSRDVDSIVGHEMYTSEVYLYASPLHKLQFSKSSIPALCKSLEEKGLVVLNDSSDGELISITESGAKELNFWK